MLPVSRTIGRIGDVVVRKHRDSLSCMLLFEYKFRVRPCGSMRMRQRHKGVDPSVEVTDEGWDRGCPVQLGSWTRSEGWLGQ